MHCPQVQRCTLLSIKTGGCPENCGYCSQSRWGCAAAGLLLARRYRIVLSHWLAVASLQLLASSSGCPESCCCCSQSRWGRAAAPGSASAALLHDAAAPQSAGAAAAPPYAEQGGWPGCGRSNDSCPLTHCASFSCSHWSKETGTKAEKLMGLEEVYEVRLIQQSTSRVVQSTQHWPCMCSIYSGGLAGCPRGQKAS